MQSAATRKADRIGEAESGRSPAAATPLSHVEVASRFEAASPTLWCIAAGVLGRRDGAEDVLQEAAMIALEKRHQFNDHALESSFTAWAGRIVRFVALNTVRRRIRHRGVPIDPLVIDRTTTRLADVDDQPVDQYGQVTADQRSFDDRVVEALNTLAPTVRACLLLRTVQGLAYRDIAQALGVPEGTAMSHVHRARHAMRQQLSEGAPRGRGRSSS